MYDRLFDYQFEEALSDLDRVCDWEANCLSEEAHKRMLERASKEHEEAMKAIERWYHK